MKTINLQELTKMIEPGKKHPIIINTLPKNDFLKQHIPGSINVPADQISKKAPELFAKHDWLVVYCTGPKCETSKKAAEYLQKLGYENVFRFEGGLEEWTKQNKYLNRDAA